jgi:hypothetical protein
MADLYSPTNHSDGELINAGTLNKIEQGLDAVDNALDDQVDRIDALYANGGGGAASQISSGPTANRPQPSIGLLFYDTTISKVIVGTGSAWTNLDGSALSGSGSSTAPTNMAASVTDGGTIGQINLSWTGVTGASYYTLYETESPSGVSGATQLAVTSSVRTPSTARNYDYWVTATVNGVETASSNHVTATLPYTGSGSGGPTGTDPSTFLNINGKGTGTGGWWNLGIGYAAGHTDITPTQLQNGFIDSPYYTMNGTGTAVQMEVFLNGGKTSTNTKYPRCEFREMATGSTSTKASWNGASGTHIMRGASKVVHMGPVKPEVVVAQIHDAVDDTLQILVQGSSASGSETWSLKVNGSAVATLLTGVALGTEVAWDIQVSNGTLTVKVNGTTKYTGNPGYGAGQYFKVGTYPQQNTTDQSNPTSEYSRIELRNLFVSHS